MVEIRQEDVDPLIATTYRGCIETCAAMDDWEGVEIFADKAWNDPEVQRRVAARLMRDLGANNGTY